MTFADVVGVFAECITPCTFQRIAECVFDAIRATVLNLDRFIFTAADDDGQIGMEDSEGNMLARGSFWDNPRL